MWPQPESAYERPVQEPQSVRELADRPADRTPRPQIELTPRPDRDQEDQ